MDRHVNSRPTHEIRKSHVKLPDRTPEEHEAAVQRMVTRYEAGLEIFENPLDSTAGL